jgi:hypothetical protein
MTQEVRCLQVRIADDLFDVPLACVARVGLLDKVSWSGSDADGGPLVLAQTDHGPMVVLSASAFLKSAVASPEPAWAIVAAGHQQPVLAYAVCQVLGFVRSQTPAEMIIPSATASHPIAL